MRILFVLPAPVRVPSGGAAVVYRHAVGLANRGHEVRVVAPKRMDGLRGHVRAMAGLVRNRLQDIEERPWHQLESVESQEVPSSADLDARGFDAVIATGHQTAPWVHRVVSQGTALGVYFIQGDERYQSKRAKATWALPLVRVTVSWWLADLLKSHEAPVQAVLPNAVDPDVYSPIRSLKDRECRVVALYHRHPVKGPKTLVAALEHLRALVPEVSADIITSRLPEHRLPDWTTVHVRPSHSELSSLYNRASVCLHTSRLEGWGLVPMEAAACGCAVVATASRGVSEYLTAGRSMLLVDPGDSIGLAMQASSLLVSSAQRQEIATAGVQDVSRFSWEASTDRLEQVLLAPR